MLLKKLGRGEILKQFDWVWLMIDWREKIKNKRKIRKQSVWALLKEVIDHKHHPNTGNS